MLLGVRTIIIGLPSLPARLNLDLLTTADVRDCLKARSHLLRCGVPFDFAAVETLTIIIDHYRYKVGLPKYLSEMLGEVANEPVSDCALYWLDGSRIATPAKSEQPVLRFLRRFGGGVLPFKVVANEETRYL